MVKGVNKIRTEPNDWSLESWLGFGESSPNSRTIQLSELYTLPRWFINVLFRLDGGDCVPIAQSWLGLGTGRPLLPKRNNFTLAWTILSLRRPEISISFPKTGIEPLVTSGKGMKGCFILQWRGHFSTGWAAFLPSRKNRNMWLNNQLERQRYDTILMVVVGS